MSDTPKCEGPADRLRSVELAEMIVDALLRANIVKQQDVKRSVAIATEEIDARKALGDY